MVDLSVVFNAVCFGFECYQQQIITLLYGKYHQEEGQNMQKSHNSQPATQVLNWIKGDDSKTNYKPFKLCISVSRMCSIKFQTQAVPLDGTS